MSTLPTDSLARKDIPLARGVLDYFPAALAAVAQLSMEGNKKHNPGEELHWARGKSMDHADCIMRHLAERGTIDTDGLSHSVKVAWRALALLQEELEAQGAPMARGARLATPEPTSVSKAADTHSGRQQRREKVAGALGRDTKGICGWSKCSACGVYDV